MMEMQDILDYLQILDREKRCIKEIKDDTVKLFLCRKCQDVVRCFKDLRTCKCGESSGHYTDKVNAVFRGEHCVPMGMGGGDLVKALKMADIENKHQKEPTTCKGVGFSAFVILDCSTAIKVDKG
jgi:hypothetical protein